MELKSDPKFDTINVTDIDVGYSAGTQMHSLREGDATYVETDDAITITFSNGGIVRLLKRNADFIAILPRTIRVTKPEASKAAE